MTENLQIIEKGQIFLNEKLLKNSENDKYLTAAYENFINRVNTKYILAADFSDISTLEKILKMHEGIKYFLKSCLGIPCIFPALYYWSRCSFQVPANHFALVANSSGKSIHTEIYGPGYHYLGRYYSLLGIYSFRNTYPNNLIRSLYQDLQITIVEQGTIAHFELGGQNIILGPGIHLIEEPLTFIKKVSLDAFYIEIGPEKWVTIPDGYVGISVDLGEIHILEGGKQHHLSHIGHKFVKLVPMTLQSDRIPSDVDTYIQNLTDINNILNFNQNDPKGADVILDAMVFWRIIDVKKAAKNAMEILLIDDDDFISQNINLDYIEKKKNKKLGKYEDVLDKNTEKEQIKLASKNINYLRLTIIRIVKHYLTALVGETTLSSYSSSLGAKIHEKTLEEIIYEKDPVSFDILKTLKKRQNGLMSKINSHLNKLGIVIENFCIFSVKTTPEIQQLLDQLAKEQVDYTDIIYANLYKEKIQIETQSRNEKRLKEAEATLEYKTILAKSKSNSMKLQAKGEADVIIKLAEARYKEAKEIEKIDIGKELARIREAGASGEKIVKGDSSKYFFEKKNPAGLIKEMFGIK